MKHMTPLWWLDTYSVDPHENNQTTTSETKEFREITETTDMSEYVFKFFSWNIDDLLALQNKLREYFVKDDNDCTIDDAISLLDNSMFTSYHEKAMRKIFKENWDPEIKFNDISEHFDTKKRYWPSSPEAHYHAGKMCINMNKLSGSFNDLLFYLFAELSHAEQFNTWGVKNFINNRRLKNDRLGYDELEVYETPGTIEYNAHQIIQPYLKRQWLKTSIFMLFDDFKEESISQSLVKQYLLRNLIPARVITEKRRIDVDDATELTEKLCSLSRTKNDFDTLSPEERGKYSAFLYRLITPLTFILPKWDDLRMKLKTHFDEFMDWKWEIENSKVWRIDEETLINRPAYLSLLSTPEWTEKQAKEFIYAMYKSNVSSPEEAPYKNSENNKTK